MSSTNFTTVSPGHAVDCRRADDVEFQVVGLSGGDTITASRSLDKTNYVTAELLTATYDAAGNPVTANGLFMVAGACHLKFTQAGSASAPTITVCLRTDD